MATAEQIKSLIRLHYSDDPERFNTIALQLAAHEAKMGHGGLAHEIRNLVDKSRSKNKSIVLKFPKDLRGLVLSDIPKISKAKLVTPSSLKIRIERVIREYRQKNKLKSHGLSHRRKVLLIGPPGTGKTLSARIFAHELRLSLNTIQVDKLVTKFMGETSAKLRQIFDLIQQEPGVYFFDEFDAIAGERTFDNDVGEMRRVLNSYLQFIEQDKSDSLIIAATNSPGLLDRALFRRFDDVLIFNLPDDKDRKKLIKNVLSSFIFLNFKWKLPLTLSKGLSHSEIEQACKDAIKQVILSNKKRVNNKLLEQMLKERFSAHTENND